MSFVERNGNKILVVASILLTLAICETVLHMSNYKALLHTSPLPRDYFIKDDVLGYDIGKDRKERIHTILDVSYGVWSNNLGCFDDDYRGENPFIYMAGDSFSWGYAPFEASWGVKIEELTGTRVLKCGVPAYGTKQELIKASRILATSSPKLIIVGYTRDNDPGGDFNFPDTTVRKGYLVSNMTRSGLSDAQKEEIYSHQETFCTAEELRVPWVQYVKCRLRNNSILYNLSKNILRDAANVVFSPKVLESVGVIVEKKAVAIPEMMMADSKSHLDNILGFKALAQEKGARLLFVLVPSKANEELKPFLDREGIEYLDLRPEFERYSEIKPLRWKSDHHWNLAGNLLVGVLVSKRMIEGGMIQVLDKEKALRKMEDELVREFGLVSGGF